jgi:hypothetical protein
LTTAEAADAEEVRLETLASDEARFEREREEGSEQRDRKL